MSLAAPERPAVRRTRSPAPPAPRRRDAVVRAATKSTPVRTVRRMPRLIISVALLVAVLMTGLVWVNTARVAITAETADLLERERVALAQLAEARLDTATLEAQVLEAAQAQLGMVPAAQAGLIRIPRER